MLDKRRGLYKTISWFCQLDTCLGQNHTLRGKTQDDPTLGIPCLVDDMVDLVMGVYVQMFYTMHRKVPFSERKKANSFGGNTHPEKYICPKAKKQYQVTVDYKAMFFRFQLGVGKIVIPVRDKTIV